MGIRFACNTCGHVLNVKQHLAGKRGICPKCQSRFEIPLESTIERKRKDKDPPEIETDVSVQVATAPAAATTAATQAAASSPAAAAQPTQPASSLAHSAPAPSAPAPAAPPDPIAENLLLQWYVAPPGGTTPYGPAPGDMFRGWITEGRVSADSMVWRQDWSEWRRAGDVLPQLMPTTYVAPTPSYSAPTQPEASPAPSFEAPTTFVEHSTPGLMTPGAPSSGTAALIAQRKPKKGTMAIMVVLGLLVIVLTVVAWIVIKGR